MRIAASRPGSSTRARDRADPAARSVAGARAKRKSAVLPLSSNATCKPRNSVGGQIILDGGSEAEIGIGFARITAASAARVVANVLIWACGKLSRIDALERKTFLYRDARSRELGATAITVAVAAYHGRRGRAEIRRGEMKHCSRSGVRATLINRSTLPGACGGEQLRHVRKHLGFDDDVRPHQRAQIVDAHAGQLPSCRACRTAANRPRARRRSISRGTCAAA